MKVDHSIIEQLSSKYVQDFVLAQLGFYNADLYFMPLPDREDVPGYVVYRRAWRSQINLHVFDSVSSFEHWFCDLE